MDVQTLCLGALTLGEASGYEIKKLFEEGPFAYFHQASYGSIYPGLGKLLKKGLITMREQEQDGRPDKKVYAITAAGQAVLGRNLKKQPAPDKIRSEAMLMFFLADHLDAAHLNDVFDGYLADYRNKLECVSQPDERDMPPHCRFARGFGQAFYRTAIRYMEENKDLLLGPSKQGAE